jgi:hypothetical protein
MESSDDDTDYADCYTITDPVIVLQKKIIENLSPYNYLKVCLNVAHIVDNYLPDRSTQNQRISLAVLILDSIHDLRQLRPYNYSMMESLTDLAYHKEKLNPLRKKIGYFQWFMSFIY